jgi:hypothetical protein
MHEIQAISGDRQNIIRELRDKGFESSDEQLAVALGRPVHEIAAIVNGAEEPDEDAVMKARGIAEQRGIELGGAPEEPQARKQAN